MINFLVWKFITMKTRFALISYFFFMATPTAYGSTWAGNLIWAAAGQHWILSPAAPAWALNRYLCNNPATIVGFLTHYTKAGTPLSYVCPLWSAEKKIIIRLWMFHYEECFNFIFLENVFMWGLIDGNTHTEKNFFILPCKKWGSVLCSFYGLSMHIMLYTYYTMSHTYTCIL